MKTEGTVLQAGAQSRTGGLSAGPPSWAGVTQSAADVGRAGAAVWFLGAPSPPRCILCSVFTEAWWYREGQGACFALLLTLGVPRSSLWQLGKLRPAEAKAACLKSPRDAKERRSLEARPLCTLFQVLVRFVLFSQD